MPTPRHAPPAAATAPHSGRRAGAACGRWCRFALLDARSLAAFRIALGCIVVADAGARTRDVATMFAPDGTFPVDLLRDALGGPTAWSLAWLDDSLPWARVLLALQAGAGAAVALGWQTRWATALAWIVVVSVIRRTAPATNAGDLWLGCLLLWGIFLPLGARWSVDAITRRGVATAEPGNAVALPATAALVIQIAVVYLSAGISKCNATWLAGDAVGLALSIHDHGTQFGNWVAPCHWVTAPAGWAIVALELACAPLLLLTPTVAVRTWLVAVFVLLHAAVWVTMSVGLFAPVGIAAWLALIPGRVWDRLGAGVAGATACGPPPSGPLAVAGQAGVIPLLAVALASAVLAHRPEGTPIPDGLRLAIRLSALEQDWRMFGDVRPQQQWTKAEARLADGRIVDLLRNGEPVVPGPPSGGYSSLPHHRWHKLCWDLHRPVQRRFAASLAATLASRWNLTHPDGVRVEEVEIRTGRRRGAEQQEFLVAAWPARSPAGRGNLDRFLSSPPAAVPEAGQ